MVLCELPDYGSCEFPLYSLDKLPDRLFISFPKWLCVSFQLQGWRVCFSIMCPNWIPL
ncbi:hypothetical protein F383_33406 [Gossypium arboreum]|uniref:Uncharacterized protein n=1 Tax=Gossypium arboreum TaxID=29729 RepID=A0A0B0PQ41_GOSAR|nr:hypothetical protein F383_33406 [Gossypium arboreum]